jgi:outer membrane protein TolC
MSQITSHLGKGLVLTLGLVGLATPAAALQPLKQFIDASREHSPDARESRANEQAADAQTDVTLGRALPSIDLRGTYTWNQYAVVLPLSLLEPGAPANAVLTLTPTNQLDFYATLSVPLVDLASFRRIKSSKTNLEAATQQDAAVQLQIESQVAQNYYQLVADLALARAAQRALEVAKASQELTRHRVELGQAPVLEDDRAAAQVEASIQQLAQTQLLISVATQALVSVSGIQPDISGDVAPLQDDLHPEPPVDQFQPPAGGTPGMAAAVLARQSAEQQAQAARFQMVPVLSGNVNEHTGNYLGFSGHDSAVTAGVGLNWYLDYTVYSAIRAQDAQVAVAEARVQRANQSTIDAIHNSWAAVAAAIARSHSARAQELVTRHAEDMAKDRYQLGATTQLDLLQAERDSFAAEVARIQADADLVNARTQLRLAAGTDPFASSGASP